MSWMREDGWNSVSTLAAVVAIISFKRKDVLESSAKGVDDDVNTDS